jgi:GNAT superfamily N-acetyltransferase
MAEAVSIVVREAVLADAGAISEVDRASHIAAYSPIFGPAYEPRVRSREALPQWQRILRGEGDPQRAARWVLVACIDDSVVAYSGLMPSRDADAERGSTGEVGAIYVHPDWWRKGLGAVLLNASLQFLANQGFSAATLWAMEEKRRARAFYEAEGWTDDGGRQQLDMDFPGINLTEVRYRKAITAG